MDSSKGRRGLGRRDSPPSSSASGAWLMTAVQRVLCNVCLARVGEVTRGQWKGFRLFRGQSVQILRLLVGKPSYSE